jgi:hypothetical protein
MLSWQGCLPFFLLFQDNNKTIKQINLFAERYVQTRLLAQVSGGGGEMAAHHELFC